MVVDVLYCQYNFKYRVQNYYVGGFVVLGLDTILIFRLFAFNVRAWGGVSCDLVVLG